MILQSERLTLKKFEKAGLEDYISVVTNNNVMKYLTGESLKVEDAKAKFEQIISLNQVDEDLGYFSIIRKRDNLFIGYAKLAKFQENQIEIGCCLLPDFWGNDYATEMFNFIIKHGSQIQSTKELVAIINVENRGSRTILLKSNFVVFKTDIIGLIQKEYYKLVL